jgi:hypothetical protein
VPKDPVHFFDLSFLFDLGTRFFVPTHTNDALSRAEAVEQGAMAPPQGFVFAKTWYDTGPKPSSGTTAFAS